MGSFFAGIKAGTLGGLIYIGGLTVFNIALLYALKTDVYVAISQTQSQFCTPLGSGNSTNIDECFSLVVTVYVPFIAFLGFLISLLFAGAFGSFYERIPGRGRTFKAETIAAVLGITFVFSPYWLGVNLVGFFFDYASAAAVSGFFLAWTIVYGLVLGRLYARYTRLVRFESDVPDSVKVLVGGRDRTGTATTLAFTSTHQLRAEVGEDFSFKEWAVSGGVTVDDPRSFETLMEVNGDGMVKARGGKKY